MIIHKNLKLFLHEIYISDSKLEPIQKHDLKKYFKKNEYYLLEKFCIINELIIFEYEKVYLTNKGYKLYEVIKSLLI